MKKIVLSLAAVTAIAGAIPTAALADHDRYDRRYEQSPRGGALTSRVDGLEWKIDNAFRQHRISRGQASQLLRELRQIQPLAHRVQTGHASRWERDRLYGGVERIESAVNGYRNYGYYR